MPHKLENRGREIYYRLFSMIAEDVNLELDGDNYVKVVISTKRSTGFANITGKKNKVVAIVESDALVGDTDGLTNQFFAGHLNTRKYDGLEIHMIDKDYKDQLSDLVLLLRAILKEEVVFIDKSQEADQLLEKIQPALGYRK